MASTPAVALGLDRMVRDGFARLKGRRVALLCHAASVDSAFRHLTQRCREAGVDVRRCFGPEHGIWADAQDMIPVDGVGREPVTGAPVHSLYGAEEASLSPRLADLADVDVLVVDLQDVGARYYTYVYTAALALRAAAKVGLEVMVLDRPNPLGGVAVEGPAVDEDLRSFVGMWSLPTRHGLTIGEVLTLLDAEEGWGARFEIVEMTGWRREMEHGDTGLPWVQPSPNMPTADTARVYPGMCLIEGTNLSEGRGTTRPFELVGADFIDPFALAAGLAETPVAGVVARPVFFQPTFHKYAGRSIGGVALHVTDPRRFEPLRFGLHFLAEVRRLWPSALAWREEVYEFVRDRLAIDLLFGTRDARLAIDAGEPVDPLWQRWQAHAAAFEDRRRPFLRYGVA